MSTTSSARAAGIVLGAALLALPGSSGAAATDHRDVVESELVPALSPTFVPWDCHLRRSGAVCRGERHLDTAWAPTDLPIPCDVPIWGSRTEDRYQTRYHDRDGRNYLREFRSRDVDHLSTSPTGPSTASVRTRVRFTETFAVPGDDTTRTITTRGVLSDVRATHGPSLHRVVGTLVEPFDAPATFTGEVTVAGVATRYRDAPAEVAIDTDGFFGAMCDAATADR